MINSFYEKLANLAVNYSIKVKKGDRVAIEGPALAEELFLALYLEIIKAGGHALLFPEIKGTKELFYKYASDDQLLYLDNIIKVMAKEIDCYIGIFGDYNTNKLSLIDPKIIAKHKGSPEQRKLMDLFYGRWAKGDLRWVGIPIPCQSFAQEAKMDLFSYTEFVEKALFLDKEDPIQEWSNIDKNQEIIVDYLNKVDKIQVIGEDTDLTLSVKGRKWLNCSGQVNLPDGEVFTGPIENSVNGHIRFTYPGIYSNREIENIFLEFDEGKVINYSADKGEDLLKEILIIENADRLGEFAIGTNFGITQFTKHMLFDEKIGGTLHCALGLGFGQTGSKNESAIHWDILKDMKLPGSKIIADGNVIYEEGKWLIPPKI